MIMTDEGPKETVSEWAEEMIPRKRVCIVYRIFVFN
jgi:hypothetical protein